MYLTEVKLIKIINDVIVFDLLIFDMTLMCIQLKHILLSRMFRTASIQLCPGKFSLLDFWVSVFRHVLFFLMFTLRSDDLFPDFYLINFKNTILVIIYYDKVPIYTHFTTNWTSILSCMYYPTSASCIINLSAYVWFPFTSLHFFFCRIKRWAID